WENLPDRIELRFGIDDEDGYVNHVVERTVCSFQDCVQVFEGEPYLCFQVGLGGAVFAAADLSRNEQQTIGADRRRVAISLIERLPAGRENHVTLCHVCLHQ